MEDAANGVPAPLQMAATAEAQTVLSARSQLQEVAALADRNGWRVAVLKGGVLAADETAVDLLDIDLLAPPAEARALAAVLEGAGYEPKGPASRLHLPKRHRPGGLPIEIHVATDPIAGPVDAAVWRRLRPFGSAPGLWRLAPPDHLWHLLVHLAVKHPHRRGSIRDLLLVHAAAHECTPDEVERVRHRSRSRAHGASMRRVLHGAEVVVGADGQDVFRWEAALLLFLRLYARRIPIPRTIQAEVANWVVVLPLGKAERRWPWRRTWHRTEGTSYAQPIAWLEQNVPPLGRAVRLAARVARVALSAVVALPLSWATRRAVRAIRGDAGS